MQNYLNLLRDVKENGIQSMDRTGTGTLSVFGRQMRFDLANGFPIMTTKKVHWRSVVYELLWFIKGDTNIGYLHDHKVTIWDEWADENGDLGPVYGHEWRSFSDPNECFAVDQLQDVLWSLQQNPFSRRHIVCAWNPLRTNEMALPPCHCLFQFYVRDNKLSCQLYQRSVDCFLGLPFNISSYSLLTCIMAKLCNYDVGEFVWTGGDTHIYLNHLEQVDTQLSRTPRALPKLRLNDRVTWSNLNGGKCELEDFALEGYDPYPVIKAPIAV